MKSAWISSPLEVPRAARSWLLLVTIALLVSLQFQNLLIALLRAHASIPVRLSHLVPRIFFLLLFTCAIWLRLLESFLDPFARHSGGLIRKDEFPLIAAIMLFILWSFFSGAVNGNRLVVTLNGIYVYVAYFLVFFVFSSMTWSGVQIERVYGSLLKLAVLMASIAVLQEIVALTYPPSAYWWPNIHKDRAMWRLGLFRAPSLLGHPNTIGTLALFFFTTELARERGGKWKIVILGAAVIFSCSRLAMAGAFLALMIFRPFARRLTFLLAPALIAAVILWRVAAAPLAADLPAHAFSYDPYRDFARRISLRVLADNLIFGVGPGQYGGHVSLKYNSPIYERYGFTGKFLRNLHLNASIEQQWLQAAAELGLGGLLVFLSLLLAPAAVAFNLRVREEDDRLRRLAAGMALVPFQMVLFLIGFTVTQQAPWLILYFILLGMLCAHRAARAGKEDNA